MLKLTNVQKNYPGFKLNMSFELKPGRITGLIGPNGSGKTTTYKAILGLISTDGGEIELFGNTVKTLSMDEKLEIGTALSESGFSGYIKVKDVVKILRSAYPNFDEAFFIEKCKAFNIPMDKQIKDFSTGMKAKLKVMVAISHNAKLLILDEPTAGLDVFARDETLSLLREYMEKDENRAILISSHISSDLETLCDDIYLINDGKVIFHEDTDKLISEYAVIKVNAEDFDALDKSYISHIKREKYSISCLTNQKQFYVDNYPDIIVQKGSIDDTVLLIIGGEII